MGVAPYTEIILASKIDDEGSIISIFKDVASKEPNASFALLNVYKELPVMNTATIFEIKGSTVEFKTTPLQLAVIELCSETLIQAPFLNAGVIGKVVYVNNVHQLVSLGHFSYAEVFCDKRNTVRVRLKRPLNINMHVDGNKVPGVIRDISLGGCCVTTLAGSLLERASKVSLHIKLFHENEVIETEVPARIVRVGGGPQYECITTFQHTAETEKVLGMFIYQRQLEIIRELKEKI